MEVAVPATRILQLSRPIGGKWLCHWRWDQLGFACSFTLCLEALLASITTVLNDGNYSSEGGADLPRFAMPTVVSGWLLSGRWRLGTLGLDSIFKSVENCRKKCQVGSVAKVTGYRLMRVGLWVSDFPLPPFSGFGLGYITLWAFLGVSRVGPF